MSGATRRCDSPGTHAKEAGTAYEILSTRTAPVSGALVIVYVTRGRHIVEKDQGFGTGPGASGFASRSSPTAVTRYDVHSANITECVSVRTVSLPDHQSEIPTPGATATVTVPMSIGSLNVSTIGASRGTRASPSTGSVDATYGGVQIVRNDHGVGTGPGAS